MAVRGRKPGFKMPEEHRSKIASTQILNRLNNCALGKVAMTSVEAQVALGLIDRVLPKLQSQEVTVTDATPFALIPEQMQDVSAWQDQFTPKAKVEH